MTGTFTSPDSERPPLNSFEVQFGAGSWERLDGLIERRRQLLEALTTDTKHNNVQTQWGMVKIHKVGLSEVAGDPLGYGYFVQLVHSRKGTELGQFSMGSNAQLCSAGPPSFCNVRRLTIDMLLEDANISNSRS